MSSDKSSFYMVNWPWMKWLVVVCFVLFRFVVIFFSHPITNMQSFFTKNFVLSDLFPFHLPLRMEIFISRSLWTRLLKAAKYEIQTPLTWRATLFRCKFSSMFPVFHLAWSTCRATKTFVADWKKLLRKVERGSTLSNKFWLCCSFFIKHFQTQLVAQQICSCPSKSANQRAAFLQPATNVFVSVQVDHARWKTRNIDEDLQRNNVARQVEGFCISYFAA